MCLSAIFKVMANIKGNIFIVTAPSGAGKSTLISRLVALDSNITFSVSVTTRPQRQSEINGKHYHFVSKERFQQLIKNQSLLEYAQVYGHCYGTSYQVVIDAVNQGQDVIFDIDWKGTKQIIEANLGIRAVTIFIMPPSMAELERRLNSRGLDNQQVINGRMKQSFNDLAYWRYYDYVLVNRNVDTTFEDLQTIIAATRVLNFSKSQDLSSHATQLESEFLQSYIQPKNNQS